jgi:thiamine biosynthesis protein ThiS
METAETKTIEVVVNGRAKRVPEGLNVLGLLRFLEIDPSRVAVELNRSIVRKADWGSARVGEGAQIEVVWFVGGGSKDDDPSSSRD